MTTQMFLMLLLAFSLLTELVTEAIKRIVTDKANLSYNIVSLITAILIGGVGTSVYYYLNDIAFDGKNIVFIFLLGLASGLCSQVSYDKVVQTLKQLGITKEK